MSRRETPAIGWRDFLAEAVAGTTQRPSRTVLTLTGIVVGVAAFVAVLGLTATASGQVSEAFSMTRATLVVAHDVPADAALTHGYGFPADAEQAVRGLHGVDAVGIAWPLPGDALPSVTTSLDPRAKQVRLAVTAVTPGYFQAAGATLAQGVFFGDYAQDNRVPVAVLGSGAARDLGISHLWPIPALYIRGTGYAVVGILADVDREPEALSQILIPSAVALAAGELPSREWTARMLITTQLGAARQVAGEVPLALRPDRPELVAVDPVNDQLTIESRITGALQALLWGLAGITLFMGAVGIANTTFTTVIERTSEIGLRRAMGARRRDILGQFLGECAALGLLGGLVGTALGTLVVVGVALGNRWTALLDPLVTISGPFVGMFTALLAGARPAWKAAHIQPVEALRR